MKEEGKHRAQNIENACSQLALARIMQFLTKSHMGIEEKHRAQNNENAC